MKIFTIILTAFCLTSCTNVNAKETIKNDKYYLIDLTINTRYGKTAEPKLGSAWGGGGVEFDKDHNLYFEPDELTKNDCQSIVNEAINDNNKNFERIKKEGKYLDGKKSFAKDTYVIDYVSNYTDLYYCIPINIWNSMEPAASPEEDDYIMGDEIRFKKLESFLSILKPCGLKDHNIMHINLATTPFICDKYSEENPVPYKSFNELMGMEIWKKY